MNEDWTSPCGRVRLYRADCREILPTLGAQSVELVVTSPPYNLYKKWWDSGANGCHINMAAKFSERWYDDELPEDEYQSQQREVLEQCRRISSGAVCYNHKVRHAIKRAGRSFHPIEWTGAADLWSEITWDRGGGVALNCRRPTSVDEKVFVFGRPAAWNDRGYTNIWRIAPNKEETAHPCKFPLELPRRCIDIFTDKGMTVLDPYAGVGTTLVAALQLERRAVGIELDRDYFNEAVKRIEAELNSQPLFSSLPSENQGELWSENPSETQSITESE